jgi:hypothetical protein
MLFKTPSAAVFGIDAYLVEVEVDVGSDQMGDFNVVGLPDIAVKASRERAIERTSTFNSLWSSGYGFDSRRPFQPSAKFTFGYPSTWRPQVVPRRVGFCAHFAPKFTIV